ncbi:MAG TPA: adenine deaminase [Desulfotomaculum sp.]|nr:MAG: adenine deaminase [Peptococcaceae bacterium BRH_c8a]KJS70492.1 MAG: adenine deaminase [Desulfotomaculum sp. BICA1-6]HBX23583.1 adenine deaminase [Desulfotomaculum sp.]
MREHKIRPLNRNTLYDLIRTSRGEAEADLYIKNGTLINVYTGELQKVNIAVKGAHIAYVGTAEQMVGHQTTVVEAGGLYLCPGYIEPHAHPFHTYTPATLAEQVLALGTTTMVCDNLFFFMLMGPQQLALLWREFDQWPVKMLLSIRLDPQTYSSKRAALFEPHLLEPLLELTATKQVGELTDWPSLLAGREQMLDNIIATGSRGKRVEGHAPGASVETLNALAAAGVSACHESISGEEALRRLRLGMYATLRHSSLRQDLPVLLKSLLDAGIDLNRAMITTDGVTPPYMGAGFTDHLLRLAIEEGVPPVEAYRMATLNPATYYRMDDELGGIAPGRLADILFLEDINNPTPVRVIAEGKQVAENGQLLTKLASPNWHDYGVKPVTGSLNGLTPRDMTPPAQDEPFPLMQLVNPVITRRQDCVLPSRNGVLDISNEAGLVYAALFGRAGGWVTTGIIAGFADYLEGMACTSTITGDILVLGQNPSEMLRSANRMLDLGGGIVIAEKGTFIYELPLPLGGIMSPQPLDQLVDRCGYLYKLLAQRGHRHHDLLYTLLFLSATHLPAIRLSPAGIMSVKDKKVLVPVRKAGWPR